MKSKFLNAVKRMRTMGSIAMPAMRVNLLANYNVVTVRVNRFTWMQILACAGTFEEMEKIESKIIGNFEDHVVLMQHDLDEILEQIKNP